MAQESARNISTLRVGSRVLFRPRRTLFLLSHMRSYSSLLSHILGSHEDINGYCELHQSYRSAFSFFKLRAKLLFLLGPGKRGRYVFDKILHDHHTINESWLRSPAVTAVFMVRRPDESLKSIVSLYRRQINRKYSAEKAFKYYTRRLKTLESYSAIARNSLFIESGKVISDSEDVLAYLAYHLGLRSPLQETYQRFTATGTPFLGDSSKSIKSGKINHDHKCKAKVEIPELLLEQANEYYEHCVAELSRNCLTLDQYQENSSRQQDQQVNIS